MDTLVSLQALIMNQVFKISAAFSGEYSVNSSDFVESISTFDNVITFFSLIFPTEVSRPEL